jgi:hypothetical protein
MKLRNLVIAASLLSTGACATIMQGSEQPVSVSSTPAGATISVDGQPMGTTPAVLRLARKETHLVRLELDGYQPFDISLERKTSGWMWGNVVFGGLVGIVVDASTGAMYRLTPESIEAGMQTRTAVVDGRRTIQVAVVMTPDPSWEKIGQLRAD